MKITREALKNIVKETMIEESEYQEFFKRALEKAGKSIPSMSDEEKKKFFNNIEKTWKGKGAKNEISETELEEAQSPAQKAAFAKMLAKKDGKDESTDKKEEVKESVNEDKVSNRTVSTLEKGIQRILGTEVNHDINGNGAHEFYIDDAEFVIGINDGKEKNVAYSFSIYDDGARKYYGLNGKAADEKDLVKKVLSIAKKYKKQLLLTTESIIKEGFATWEMSFSDMNLNGVKLSKKNKYKVKARNTVEAIKKAAKMAGLKGNDWIATQTNYLKKIG